MATLIAGAGQDLVLPSMDEARATFDAGLIAEPVPESPRVAMLRELGVA